MEMKIVLGGVGGQGLIAAGEIIGNAVSECDDINATLSTSYGTESRGTFTKADLILSDSPIDYPIIDIPDVILCLAQVAYERYRNKFTDKTLIFYDSGEVIPDLTLGCEQIGFGFKEAAISLGNPAATNMAALGAMVARLGMPEPVYVEAAIKDYFSLKSEHVIDLNIKAFNIGLESMESVCWPL